MYVCSIFICTICIYIIYPLYARYVLPCPYHHAIDFLWNENMNCSLRAATKCTYPLNLWWQRSTFVRFCCAWFPSPKRTSHRSNWNHRNHQRYRGTCKWHGGNSFKFLVQVMNGLRLRISINFGQLSCIHIILQDMPDIQFQSHKPYRHKSYPP